MDFGISSQSQYKISFESLGFGEKIVTINTMNRMAQMINMGMRSFYVRRWAEKIILGTTTDYDKAEAVYNFVLNHSVYVKDPTDLEMLKGAEVSLQLIQVGDYASIDCDCASILIGALIKSIGLRYALRAVAFNNESEFTHVYGMVYAEDGWTPMDFVVGWKGGKMGEEPGAITSIKDMEV